MNVFVQPAYEVVALKPAEGMATLRSMFPDAKADSLNFVLFSTSGTHGSYLTIEDIEALNGEEPQLTVLVIQPRTVRMLYGNIDITPDDIDFLKRLRQSSADVLAEINAP